MATQVKDIMSTNIISIAPTASLDVLEQELCQQGVSGLPVLSEGKLVGIVSRSDIVSRLSTESTYAQNAYSYYEAPEISTCSTIEEREYRSNIIASRLERLKVSDIMQTAITTIPATASLSEAANIFLEKKIHRLPVIEGDHLLGVISTTDFVRQFSS